MKLKALQKIGFIKVEITPGGDYWYELNHKEHRFITNDNVYNKNTDSWFIGYENTKEGNGDVFFFNEGLNSIILFRSVYKTLTGIHFMNNVIKNQTIKPK